MTHHADFTFNYPPLYTPHASAYSSSDPSSQPPHSFTPTYVHRLGYVSTPAPTTPVVDAPAMSFAHASVFHPAPDLILANPASQEVMSTPQSAVSRSSSMSTVSGFTPRPEVLGMTSIHPFYTQHPPSAFDIGTTASTAATSSTESIPTRTPDQLPNGVWSYDALMIPDSIPKLAPGAHHPPILPHQPNYIRHIVQSPVQTPRTLEIDQTLPAQINGHARSATNLSMSSLASMQSTPKPFARTPIIAIPEHTYPPEASAWWNRYIDGQSVPTPNTPAPARVRSPRTRRQTSMMARKTVQQATRGRVGSSAASAVLSRRGSLAVQTRDTAWDAIMSSPEDLVVSSQTGTEHGQPANYPFFAGQLKATIQRSTYHPTIHEARVVGRGEDVVDDSDTRKPAGELSEPRLASIGTM